MHPKVAQALQEIDAAVFNGDTFEDPDDRVELLEYVARWTRELSIAGRSVHEGPSDDDTWTYDPGHLSQYDECTSLAIDPAGVTHAIRTWRSGPVEARHVRHHAECGVEHGSQGLALAPVPADQDVTCMACIAEGLAR